jgi:hypothetical protein
MKKIFVLLMMVVFVFGCYYPKPTFEHSKAGDVYIDPDYTWANYSYGMLAHSSHTTNRTVLRSITLRVVNTKYVDAKVRIRCEFVPTKSISVKLEHDGINVKVDYDKKNPLFGEKEEIVKARNDETFVVYGFARSIPDKEKVKCFIKSVR